MASINKLSIRGIRAFSPERDETIEFYSPLTMIVGSNGMCAMPSVVCICVLFDILTVPYLYWCTLCTV